jgi:hypothetical protein
MGYIPVSDVLPTTAPAAGAAAAALRQLRRALVAISASDGFYNYISHDSRTFLEASPQKDLIP